MALNLETKYGARANASSADYPYGSVKDKVGGVAETGTPIEADIMNDFVGLGQKLLDESSIIPSNAPDNVTSSQYYNAMTTIFPTKTELAAAGGSGLVGRGASTVAADLTALESSTAPLDGRISALESITAPLALPLNAVARNRLPIGAVSLLNTFNNTLGVELYSDGSQVYCAQSPYDLIDFEKGSSPNQYYVNYSEGNNANAGTSTGAGNSWKTLDYAVANAVNPAVINIEDELTGYLSSGQAPKIFAGKLKIKGRPERTIIAAMREGYDVASFTWAASGSNGAYVSTTASAKYYRAQFDRNYLTDKGIPRPIVNAGSQAACESTPGTFYWDGTSALYVHMFDGRVPDPATGWLFAESPYDFEIHQSNATADDVILLENLEFINNNGTATTGAGMRYRPATTGAETAARFGAKNCLSYGACSNGFQVYDADVCAIENCHTGYIHIDGFNYHSFVTTGTKGEYMTVYEYNCSSIKSGFDEWADQSALSASANGSTAHDSMHIIRVNCQHSDANGSVIADVNGCHSLNYAVNAGNPTGTASPKACFWHEKYFGYGTTKKMYLWGCSADDDGDATVKLFDNTAQAGGSAQDGDIHVKHWLGQIDGLIVGDIKDFDGGVL